MTGEHGAPTANEAERLRRWRLVLGQPADEMLLGGSSGMGLGEADRAMDCRSGCRSDVRMV